MRDERACELALRLVVSGPKCCAVSASECHEITEYLLQAYDGRPSYADKERVRQVVRDAVLKAFEAYDHGHNANRSEMADHAATRVADELCKEAP